MRKRFSAFTAFFTSLCAVCAFLLLALVLGCMTGCSPVGHTESPPPLPSVEPYGQPSAEPLPTPPDGPTLAPEPAPPSLPVETFSPLPPALPTPSPTPSPEPEEGNYFDNALFVGDSIMEGIRRYTAVQRQEGELLGNAQFLTCSTGNALADLVGDWERGIQFSYQGEERPLEEIVAEIAPRRVFLLLGLNDLASPDPVTADIVDRCIRLIGSLQTACPGVECVVITNPPKVASQWLPDYTPNRSFGNELIGAYVADLKLACSERNIPYVDAYGALKDENGALPDSYCLDGYVHLSPQGAAAVVEALEAFAEGR